MLTVFNCQEQLESPGQGSKCLPLQLGIAGVPPLPWRNGAATCSGSCREKDGCSGERRKKFKPRKKEKKNLKREPNKNFYHRTFIFILHNCSCVLVPSLPSGAEISCFSAAFLVDTGVLKQRAFLHPSCFQGCSFLPNLTQVTHAVQ